MQQTAIQAGIITDLLAERARQDAKWGPRATPTWSHILSEEHSEAVEAAVRGNTSALREELIQVAAVAMAWVEDLDRRETS